MAVSWPKLEVGALTRNGWIFTTGVAAVPRLRGEVECIIVEPINSRCKVARGQIAIPLDKVGEVCALLRKTAGKPNGAVFVIMGNDFPDRVYTDEAEADAYVTRKNAEDKAEYPHRRVFWRVYAEALNPSV